MNVRTLPDFAAIADNINEKWEIEDVLRDVFTKGYYAGYIDTEQQEDVANA